MVQYELAQKAYSATKAAVKAEKGKPHHATLSEFLDREVKPSVSGYEARRKNLEENTLIAFASFHQPAVDEWLAAVQKMGMPRAQTIARDRVVNLRDQRAIYDEFSRRAKEGDRDAVEMALKLRPALPLDAKLR